MKQRKNPTAEEQAYAEGAPEEQQAAEHTEPSAEEQQAETATEEQFAPPEPSATKKNFRYRVELLHANNSKEEIRKEVVANSYDESLQLLESELLAMRAEEPGLRWRIVS